MRGWCPAEELGPPGTERGWGHSGLDLATALRWEVESARKGGRLGISREGALLRLQQTLQGKSGLKVLLSVRISAQQYSEGH